jgi:hypothetical protein
VIQILLAGSGDLSARGLTLLETGSQKTLTLRGWRPSGSPFSAATRPVRSIAEVGNTVENGIRTEGIQKRRPLKQPQPTVFILSDREVEVLAFGYLLEPEELRAEVSFEAWLRCRHAGQPNSDRVRWEH